MTNYTINYKKLYEGAKEPTRGSEYAAGYDLHACITCGDVNINPGECVKIPTGIVVELPECTFGGVFARSGLSTKQGLRPANCVGVIDSDYRGELLVPLYNDSDVIRTVRNGDRVAQLIIIPFASASFVEMNDLSNTDRGNNGFGSTDK